ncbi:CatB-related O-acetyltransferase [Bacillus suaedae]|uniref:CatB-related O-acetyltransferase n=1 Tax=Halalkalibacter suaedae TaxID=2822140 RepID=A0A941APU5_9BACI|nr:CatB-related O-acetyltransferase [Bacillus suaedae]MBP3953155.1 CatB-related O-acetyltransferase [Bacillus suaedae]
MKYNYLLAKLIKKVQIPAIRNSRVDRTARVCSASHVLNTMLGRYSYIGNSCTVVNVTIGSFCSIADNCIIGGASHPIDWVSSSPVFHEGRNIMKKNFASHEYNTVEETVIGNDVWIGNNCLIKSGIKIEHGAVIGMGSVLTKNVGAYEIWAGNPAKFIRKRFDDDVIEKLLESNWWEWGDITLSREANCFNDVKTFLKLGE